ncbi:MAG: CGGC domain-containing protein [Blautia wexlerae]
MSPCIHSNNVCARVGCLAAFQNRTDFFQDYPEDTCLAAMMTCNGCKGVQPDRTHRRQRNPGKDRQTGQ